MADDELPPRWRQFLKSRPRARPDLGGPGLIAVAPHKRIDGVRGPGFPDKQGTPRTYDFRYSEWTAQNNKPIRLDLSVVPLLDVKAHPGNHSKFDALTRVFGTDAYLVNYLVRDQYGYWARQPRINKHGGGYEWLIAQGYRLEFHGLTADLDNPGHEPWGNGYDWFNTLSMALEAPETATAIMWASRRGWRIHQRLWVPITDPEEYEARQEVWLKGIERAGFSPDWKCVDWTRFQGAPFVTRPGQTTYRPPWPCYAQSRPVDPAVFEPAYYVQGEDLTSSESVDATGEESTPKPPKQPKVKKPKQPRAPQPVWDNKLPDRWSRFATHLSDALKPVMPGLRGAYHQLFLDLAGTLCHSNSVPPSYVPEIVARVAHVAGARDPEHHRKSAQDTTRKWAAGEPVTGIEQVRGPCPELAEAIEKFLRGARREHIAEKVKAARASAQNVTSANELARLFEVGRGVHLIEVPTGGGKSEAMLTFAQNRALDAATRAFDYYEKRDPDLEGDVVDPRAPTMRGKTTDRTGITTPNHRLLTEIEDRCKKSGVVPKRLIGQASHETNGDPTCKHIAVAMTLARFGLSVKHHLCDGRHIPNMACKYRETCAAYAGFTGNEDSPIMLAPHASLPVVCDHVGERGVIGIDEPPDPVKIEHVAVEQFEALVAAVSKKLFPEPFFRQWRDAMAPALIAITAWARDSDIDGAAVPIEDAVQWGLDAIEPAELLRACNAANVDPTGDKLQIVLECARLAQPEKHAGKPPSILASAMRYMIENPVYLAKISPLAEPARLLSAMFAPGAVSLVRMGERLSLRKAAITTWNPMLLKAMQRTGPTFLLDAGAAVHLQPLTAMIGGAPKYTRLRFEELAEIERVWLEDRHADRKTWINQTTQVPQWAMFARALDRAVAYAEENQFARKLLIVTFKAMMDGLETAGSPYGAYAIMAGKQKAKRLDETDPSVKMLRPIIERWMKRGGAELVFGYYGGIRGFDGLKDFDVAITLGDAWMNGEDQEDEAAFLKLFDEAADPEERWRLRASVELEQGLGRLRTIYRNRSGRLAHLGRVLPHGEPWESNVEKRAAPVFGGQAPKPVDQAEAAWFRACVEKLGGVERVSALVNFVPMSIYRYMNGERAIPIDLKIRIEELMADVAEEGT